MTRRYFITGTDTDVGKTFVTTLILRIFSGQGLKVAGYKPVASGAFETSSGLRNLDAEALLKATNISDIDYEAVNPYCFATATAPHIASHNEGTIIDFKRMAHGMETLSKHTDLLLIEGAGGWLTPLSRNHTFADWVVMQQLPVIVVVGLKLGCINHTLLTLKAITQVGLTVAGWIANVAHDDQDPYFADYVTSIREQTASPYLGYVPYCISREMPDHYAILDLSTIIE